MKNAAIPRQRAAGRARSRGALAGLERDAAARAPAASRPKLTPPIKLAMHGAIYEWLRPLAAGREVVDIGCAEGFGSVVLAETARRVIGIDTDAALVAEAQCLSARANVVYRLADCAALEADAAADVVVVNAVIEHVADPAPLLAGALRTLRAGGALAIGTKNFHHCIKGADGSPLYDNHYHEYTAAELQALASERLAEVRLYGLLMTPRAEAFLTRRAAVGAEALLVRYGVKQLIPKGLRNWVRARLTGVKLESLASADFFVEPLDPDDPAATAAAAYLIAVGRKRGR